MVKATTTRVIAFDLDEALSFEGDSGPYLQYSMVRARNIRRRLDQEGLASTCAPEDVGKLPGEVWTDDLWDLILTVAQTPELLERTGETLELSLIARRALDLAHQFHAIYHRHPLLQEPREDVRTARLATVQIFTEGLGELADLIGVPVPSRM